MSQQEIGSFFGVTKERINQIEKRAMEKLGPKIEEFLSSLNLPA